jgi:hypothetical protein
VNRRLRLSPAVAAVGLLAAGGLRVRGGGHSLPALQLRARLRARVHDPAEQLRICSRLRTASDSSSCVRGARVANLQDAPPETHLRLIGGCRRVPRASRSACYEWLGKALAVLTDGEFARTGCPQLEVDARRSCEAGAAAMDGPLVTFS